MLWTQLIIVAILLGVVVYFVRSEPSASHLALRRLTLIAALGVGIVVVLWPGLLTAVANLLGIGRGTDLLLYASIIAGILYVVSDYKRSVLMSRTTTELARALALTEARLEDLIREGRAPAVGDAEAHPPKIDS